jgi:tRNA A58 N-methylase Trm61
LDKWEREWKVEPIRVPQTPPGQDTTEEADRAKLPQTPLDPGTRVTQLPVRERVVEEGVGAGGVGGYLPLLTSYDERVDELAAYLYSSQEASEELERQLKVRMEELGLEYDDTRETVANGDCGPDAIACLAGSPRDEILW